MGQAKLRGTFEQRKAQAITVGRVKSVQLEPQQNVHVIGGLASHRSLAAAITYALLQSHRLK